MKNSRILPTVVIGVAIILFLVFLVAPVALLTANLWAPGVKEQLPESAHQIPVFPGAERYDESRTGMIGQGYEIKYMTAATVSAYDVLEFYQKESVAQGWAIAKEQDGYSAEYRKGRSRVRVRAAECGYNSDPSNGWYASHDSQCDRKPDGFRAIKVSVSNL